MSLFWPRGPEIAFTFLRNELIVKLQNSKMGQSYQNKGEDFRYFLMWPGYFLRWPSYFKNDPVTFKNDYLITLAMEYSRSQTCWRVWWRDIAPALGGGDSCTRMKACAAPHSGWLSSWQPCSSTREIPRIWPP